MTDDEILAGVRRAAEAQLGSTAGLSGATSEQIARGEGELRAPLHPLHARILREVGDGGGFGPGAGFLGTRTDIGGGTLASMSELRRWIVGDASQYDLLVPVIDFGSGAWALVDATGGTIVITDGGHVVDTGVTFRVLLERWIDGASGPADVEPLLFAPRTVSGMNPFTKQPMTRVVRGQPVGVPYRRDVHGPWRDRG